MVKWRRKRNKGREMKGVSEGMRFATLGLNVRVVRGRIYRLQVFLCCKSLFAWTQGDDRCGGRKQKE